MTTNSKRNFPMPFCKCLMQQHLPCAVCVAHRNISKGKLEVIREEKVFRRRALNTSLIPSPPPQKWNTRKRCKNREAESGTILVGRVDVGMGQPRFH